MDVQCTLWLVGSRALKMTGSDLNRDRPFRRDLRRVRDDDAWPQSLAAIRSREDHSYTQLLQSLMVSFAAAASSAVAPSLRSGGDHGCPHAPGLLAHSGPQRRHLCCLILGICALSIETLCEVVCRIFVFFLFLRRRRAARDEEGRMMMRTIVGPGGEGERRVMQRKRSVNLKLMWFVVIGRFPTCKSHLKVVRFQYSTRFTSSTEMVFVLVFGIGHVGDAVNNVLSPKCSQDLDLSIHFCRLNW
ncbi:hypothetical protein AAG906_036714 [Vitis piasezkii]